MQQVLANPGVLERYQVLEYSALSLVLKELKLNAMPPCEWNLTNLSVKDITFTTLLRL